MAGLALALAKLGQKVTYVAEQSMSPERTRQGWAAPTLPGVRTFYAADRAAAVALARDAADTSIHFCQGIRANGVVGIAQHALGERNLRSWVVMETVNDAVWYGALKRAEYARLFRWRRHLIEGVLATGHRTAAWVVARGLPTSAVYPFAYFLSEDASKPPRPQSSRPFRFIFVGQLITRKRVDWILNALAQVQCGNLELWVVGSGSEQRYLRRLAENLRVANWVRWVGSLASAQVSEAMAEADCLLLPSIHDGWGAVASEAMMVGTPVVCSDACGAAGAVRASGKGGVFPVQDGEAFAQLLKQQLAAGVIALAERQRLAAWATCMGATAGATYLLEILANKQRSGAPRPVEPWLRKVHTCAAS